MTGGMSVGLAGSPIAACIDSQRWPDASVADPSSPEAAPALCTLSPADSTEPWSVPAAEPAGEPDGNAGLRKVGSVGGPVALLDGEGQLQGERRFCLY
jgi:hypothetical protein